MCCRDGVDSSLLEYLQDYYPTQQRVNQVSAAAAKRMLTAKGSDWVLSVLVGALQHLKRHGSMTLTPWLAVTTPVRCFCYWVNHRCSCGEGVKHLHPTTPVPAGNTTADGVLHHRSAVCLPLFVLFLSAHGKRCSKRPKIGCWRLLRAVTMRD